MATLCTSTESPIQTVQVGLQSAWMILRLGVYLALLSTPAVAGTIIDVSAETSTVVSTGDQLVFRLLTWNYAMNAANFGLATTPTDVSFVLVTDPLRALGGFSARLETADGAFSMLFDSVTAGTGYFQGSEYDGEVSTLQGYLHLSTTAAEKFFADPWAKIVLLNNGPSVTVGFTPYVLQQDLYTSLSGESLSVGAIPGPVELDEATKPSSSKLRGGLLGLGTDTQVPEPGTAGLLLPPLLVCGLGLLLKRYPVSH